MPISNFPIQRFLQFTISKKKMKNSKVPKRECSLGTRDSMSSSFRVTKWDGERSWGPTSCCHGDHPVYRPRPPSSSLWRNKSRDSIAGHLNGRLDVGLQKGVGINTDFSTWFAKNIGYYTSNGRNTLGTHFVLNLEYKRGAARIWNAKLAHLSTKWANLNTWGTHYDLECVLSKNTL